MAPKSLGGSAPDRRPPGGTGKPEAGEARRKRSGDRPPPPPRRENVGRGSRGRASSAASVGEARSRGARSPLLVASAHEPESSRRREPLPWGRGRAVKARARQEPNESEGGRGGRQARASA